MEPQPHAGMPGLKVSTTRSEDQAIGLRIAKYTSNRSERWNTFPPRWNPQRFNSASPMLSQYARNFTVLRLRRILQPLDSRCAMTLIRSMGLGRGKWLADAGRARSS